MKRYNRLVPSKTKEDALYHIKDDKRMCASAGLISDALSRLLARCAFEDISITAICTEAGVSRATFYRLFDEPADVIAWRCEQFGEGLAKALGGHDEREIAESFFSAWMANFALLDLIMRIHREDILYEAHSRHIDTIGPALLDVPHVSDYHAQVLASVMVGALVAWERGGKRETPAQFVDALFGVLSDLGRMAEDARGR